MIEEGFIVLKDGRYFIGWWFCQNLRMNWFGTVFRDGGKLTYGTSDWELRYSFRYFHPQSTRKKDLDRKNRWVGTMHYTEDEAFFQFDKLAHEAADDMGAILQYTDLRTDNVEKIAKKLAQQPWANLKELK